MRKYRLPIILVIVLLGVLLSIYLFRNGSSAPQLKTSRAAHKEIQLVVNTNGIVEPIDRSEVYAPIDALIAGIFQEEGAVVSKGQVLIQLECDICA